MIDAEDHLACLHVPAQQVACQHQVEEDPPADELAMPVAATVVLEHLAIDGNGPTEAPCENVNGFQDPPLSGAPYRSLQPATDAASVDLLVSPAGPPAATHPTVRTKDGGVRDEFSCEQLH